MTPPTPTTLALDALDKVLDALEALHLVEKPMPTADDYADLCEMYSVQQVMRAADLHLANKQLCSIKTLKALCDTDVGDRGPDPVNLDLGKYVILTDQARGLYTGILTAWNGADQTAALTDARLLFSYKCTAGGLWGCATHGPDAGQASPPCARVVIANCSKYLLTTAEAEAKLRALVWSTT